MPLWEPARAKGVVKIASQTIRVFEAGDGFRLPGPIGAVLSAVKAVWMEGGYETREGGAFQLTFEGPVPDAQPVREFRDPQLRDAKERDLEVKFRLTFADGLAMGGDGAERLTERLTCFASVAAYVSATAVGERS